jgi:hypothetical protein
MSWSNLKRGKLALTKIKMNVIPIDLVEKTSTQERESKKILKGVPVSFLITKK